MKQRSIPYGKITLHLITIVVMAIATGWLAAIHRHTYIIITVPIAIYSITRLYSLYGEIAERLRFIFDAVKNDDYSFRFAENPHVTKYALVNYTLNRIKEVLDHTKLQIREKEKYFELIMECANIGIITVLHNGTVMQTNSMALRMIGMPRISHIDQLKAISEDFASALHQIKPQQQLTVGFTTEMGEINYLLSCSEMIFGNKELRVISIGNIREELDRKEVESWEKLTRILTHEIMNSLAPVTSISHTLLSSSNDAETLHQGLETIYSTSERLLRFVDSFRAVTRIPSPQKAPFYLSELVSEALSVVPHEGIDIEIDITPADTMLYADRTLMSQAMVNLLKNSVEAIEEYDGERTIAIRSSIDSEEHIQIELTNSGYAIPAEVAANIFTPFFTTKTDGSGIGLAVSRQIVRLHGGTLRLKHNSEGCVTFAIVLD